MTEVLLTCQLYLVSLITVMGLLPGGDVRSVRCDTGTCRRGELPQSTPDFNLTGSKRSPLRVGRVLAGPSRLGILSISLKMPYYYRFLPPHKTTEPATLLHEAGG